MKKCGKCGNDEIYDIAQIINESGEYTGLISLCQDCWDTGVKSCDECRADCYPAENLISVRQDNGKVKHFCKKCFDIHYMYCDRCGDIMKLDDEEIVNVGRWKTESWCQICSIHHTWVCHGCGQRFPLSAPCHTDDGYLYCEDCHE